MAAAALTLQEQPATIEADATGAVITNPGYWGVLVNGGSNSAWIAFSTTDTAATAPALTNAQAQGTIELPAGASINILKHYKTFFPKCNATTSVLFWYPNTNYL